ncbi:MAG: ABC transporter substrate-binding protein, partial [Chloroflexi bacterium]|nr:ABC transporter substrate-binding protein [Chloroflexota bacterium]
EKAKNAAQRLVAQEKDLVGGMGAWLSSFTLAVTEVTERERVPWLSLSYSDQITERGFKYVFQTSVTAAAQAKETFPLVLKLAETATGKRPTRVGVIHDNTASPMSFIKPMREGGFQQLGLTPVVDEIFTPPLSDATPLVQKLRNTRPEFAFINPTAIPDLKLLLEKINELGLGQGKLPLVGNGALAGTPDLLTALTPEQLEGYLVGMGNWPGKQQQQLVERFKKRYPSEPWLIQDTMTSYGHVWILKEALEKAGVADREKVAAAIRAMDISSGPVAESFSGGRVKFDERGRREGAIMPIIQWQKGVPVTVFPADVAVTQPLWPKQ